MARPITDERLAQITSPRHSSKPKYPWDQWADGQAWELERGVDYTIRSVNFRTIAYQWASRHGMRAQCRLTPDGIILRFTPLSS